MRTTLVINDEIYRQVKAKAALEGRKVTELVEEGMLAVLARPTTHQAARPTGRLRLPIIPARPGSQPLFAGMTPEEIHQRLSALELAVERERLGSSS